MTVRRGIKKIAIMIAVFATMTALPLTQAKAFSEPDGDETITCTKLTEPLAVLDVASQGRNELWPILCADDYGWSRLLSLRY